MEEEELTIFFVLLTSSLASNLSIVSRSCRKVQSNAGRCSSTFGNWRWTTTQGRFSGEVIWRENAGTTVYAFRFHC